MLSNKANCSVLPYFSVSVYANIHLLYRRRHESGWSGFGPVVVVYLRHARTHRRRRNDRHDRHDDLSF
jgi:hypothetical protein